MKNRPNLFRLALAGILLPPAALLAEPPKPNEALELKPLQRSVIYDTLTPEAARGTKVAVVTEGKGTGWVLRDATGRLYRKFMDTNRDNVVDQWRYFSKGVEVYRDIDTNFNGRADQFRW